jgi:hypothetical protein
MSTPRRTPPLPPLVPGQRLKQPEFHRRCAAYPEDVRYELVGGVVWRSRAFPGLWLDGGALLARDSARLIAVVQQGLASREHARFVQRLQGAGRKRSQVSDGRGRRTTGRGGAVNARGTAVAVGPLQWITRHPLAAALLALLLGIVVCSPFAAIGLWITARLLAPPTRLEVVAEYPGASPEEVNRQVAIPLEAAVTGIPGLKACRRQCEFGRSRLILEFERGVSPERARSEVNNRLGFIQFLPPGVEPRIYPDGS